MSDERTIEATPRRRQEARREGRVARSATLSSTIVVVGGLAVLMTFGSSAAQTIGARFRIDLGGQAALSMDREAATMQWQHLIFETLTTLLPLLIGFLCVAVLANVVQTGVTFLPKNVIPDISRINPYGGVRRIVSSSNLVTVLLGLLQLIIAGLVTWWCVRTEMGAILSLATMDAAGLIKSAGDIFFSAALKVGLGLFAIGLLDYAYRRWNHESELRMTPQQLREEARMIEGEPQLSSRRRQIYARTGPAADLNESSSNGE